MSRQRLFRAVACLLILACTSLAGCVVATPYGPGPRYHHHWGHYHYHGGYYR